MPAPCSLLLEVFEPFSLYEDHSDEVAWEVSTDPAHERPYLLAPRNLAEQEIDPIRCSVSIGTVDVGVIDPPEVPGEQSTGWMTARVHDLLGRRCRLRRYISDDEGWVTIADGPAGAPRMDASYAAYRWSIRDTRETERKLTAFQTGGVTGIVPRRPLMPWGTYTDDTGEHQLLPGALDSPVIGTYEVSALDDFHLGLVNLSSSPSPIASLVIDEPGLAAIRITDFGNDVWGCRTADVLWRVAGNTDWNVARPVSRDSFRQPFVGVTDAVVGGEDVQIANSVTLFVSDEIPDGFPLVSGATIELVIRWRGPATEDYPYYVEGPLGEVLQNLYNGVYSRAPGVDGFTYDPAEQELASDVLGSAILYDPDALAEMEEPVLLRQTEPIDDVRAFAEEKLYAPSGWIPALDADMRLSPISRNRPSGIDTSHLLDDNVTVPAPSWETGQRTVSSIAYTYPRYFIPPVDAGIELAPDGLATREVTLEFDDPESEARYGPHAEEYDASAFAAIGDEDGVQIEGQQETASLLCQTARYEVLDRYRAGVQSIAVSVRRSRIPLVRAGNWVPWSLSWLPDRTFGLRGSEVGGALIVSVRDDDCVWRSLVLEESETAAGPPGLAVSGEVVDDDPSAGFGSAPFVFSDVES